jgi:hypothetical protein
MNSALPLHEILHETKIKRKVGVVFKLDFEKKHMIKFIRISCCNV